MRKIESTDTIMHDRLDAFDSMVIDSVNKMQNKGLEVELQYSTAHSGGYSVTHSCMIIGYR